MLKTKLSNWLRKTGLLYGVDRIYFLFNKVRFNKKNKRFLQQHPHLKLPPSYVLYETYRMDYQNYFEDGKKTAKDIVQLISAQTSLENKTILDWGCGPARVVRHLPLLLPQSKIYGSDYNETIIQWCKENITDVEFRKNELVPALAFDHDFFDVVYALSVLTHLSDENHFKWINEIHRVLKPGGIFLFTTQGNAFLNKLSIGEKEDFLNGEVVIRGQVKEGHRTYSAFQPETFVHTLLKNRWKVLKFIPGSLQEWGPEQDMWMVQKTVKDGNDKPGSLAFLFL